MFFFAKDDVCKTALSAAQLDVATVAEDVDCFGGACTMVGMIGFSFVTVGADIAAAAAPLFNFFLFLFFFVLFSGAGGGGVVVGGVGCCDPSIAMPVAIEASSTCLSSGSGIWGLNLFPFTCGILLFYRIACPGRNLSTGPQWATL